MNDSTKLLFSIPIHDEASDSRSEISDWPDCIYEAEVEAVPGHSAWTIKHTLNGAPGVEAMLRTGDAVYAVNTRCAETLYSWADTSTGQVTRIDVDPDLIGGGKLILYPGVIAIRDCYMDPTGTIWEGTSISVGQGQWLIQGAPLRIDSGDQFSPLRFRPDPGMEPEGSVRIETVQIHQDTLFIVRARTDRIDSLHKDPPALIGCWATALAMLPTVAAYDISDRPDGSMTVEGSAVGRALLQRLQHEDIPLWNENEWDPIRAASIFIPLPKPSTDYEDDES